MCIILDVGALHSVFDSGTQMHQEYKPVRDWLLSRAGRAVYGGQKYAIELLNKRQYITFFSELERASKLYHAEEDKVNNLAREIHGKGYRDCDDEHLIALSIVSGCRLVCTEDKRSCLYLKSIPKMYGKPQIKAFTRAKHKKLLAHHEIKKNCDLCSKGKINIMGEPINTWLKKYSGDPGVKSKVWTK